MSVAERLVVKAAAYVLPEKVAFRLARGLLASQGVGWGGAIHSSGELKFIKHHIGELDNPCLFDVGAGVGDWSVAVLNANNSTRLHLFEPSDTHFHILKSRLTSQNVLINPFGLSDIKENRSLYKDCEVTGLASCIPRDLEHLDIHLNKVEMVRLETGDCYVVRHDIQRIDLLKIDVEGWEMSVLQGFFESFSKRLIRCCQFEFGHAHIERRENFRDFYRFFVDQGFTMGVLKPNGRVQSMRHYDEIFENYYTTNYVAILNP